MTKKMTAVVLALVMVLSLLTACGGSKKEDLIGSWIAVTMEANGEVQDLQAQAEEAGVELADVSFVLDFVDDGTMTMAFAGVEQEGTWETKGKGFEIVIAGTAQQIEIVDGCIIMANSSNGVDASVTFEKQ